MRKFLQKYKYTSLITGALTIAVLSGLGGAFIHDKYTYPTTLYESLQESTESFNRVFDMWDQCHHKTGFYAVEKPNHPDKPHPSHQKQSFTKQHYNHVIELLHKAIDAPTEDNIRHYAIANLSLQTKANEFARQYQEIGERQDNLFKDEHHDHKDGSCCEACSKGLPCTGELEEKEKNAKSKATNASSQESLQVQPPKALNSLGASYSTSLSFGGVSYLSLEEVQAFIESIKSVHIK